MQRIWDSEALADEVEPSSATPTSTRCWRRSASTTCRRARSPSGSPAAFSQGDDDEQLSVVSPARPRPAAPAATAVGVHVEGLDDVLVRLSRCCTPVPGDEIIGFVTRGRGVSVHRADCANAESLMSEQAARLIEVEWDGDRSEGDVPGRRRGRRARPLAAAARRRQRAQRAARQHRRRAARTPAPTGWPRCASSSSWPTPAISTRCCARSSRSTPSTTPTAWCPGKGRLTPSNSARR